MRPGKVQPTSIHCRKEGRQGSVRGVIGLVSMLVSSGQDVGGVESNVERLNGAADRDRLPRKLGAKEGSRRHRERGRGEETMREEQIVQYRTVG